MYVFAQSELTEFFKRDYLKGKAYEGKGYTLEQNQDRKGTNGVSTNGGTAFVLLLDILPLTCFLSPRTCQGVPFSPICQIHHFCSGPISADPVCPQPAGARLRRAPPYYYVQY